MGTADADKFAALSVEAADVRPQETAWQRVRRNGSVRIGGYALLVLLAIAAAAPWLDTVATWNPVTYILEGLRSLAIVGWQWDDIAKALAAIAVVGVISMSMCFAALRGRVKQH